ncbi:MAG: SDR family oxidoreductase [Acaryochloridaceae cyanobacterium RU_4_10]|nr:SDR family oxidoreductase [Acaryochloridaceae cyanobacterium RU_4_10]
MKAWVAGATGETGQRIVRQLVERNIAVRAFVRDRTRAQALFPESVEIAVGDVLQPEILKASMEDCDIVFCATGARPSWNPLGPYQVDCEGTKNIIDAAKSLQVKHFVLVSSLCASQFFHPLNLFWLILVWKQQAEQYLQQSGLTYTIVRPGGLRSTEDQNAITMSGADTLFEGSISRTQVAQVCIEALFHSSAQNKIVEIVSKPDATQRPFEDLFTSVAIQ